MKKYLLLFVFVFSGIMYYQSAYSQGNTKEPNSQISEQSDTCANESLQGNKVSNSTNNKSNLSDKNADEKPNRNTFNLSAETYIQGLNILVTIIIAVFGFFLALNIVSGNSNVKKAKQLIKETNAELEKLRQSKKDIINDIIKEITLERISNEANLVYINTVRNNLEKILNEDKPSSEIVYYNLTELVNCNDIELLKTISKCMGKFNNDLEIIEKCQTIIENISKNHSIKEDTI